MIKDAREAATKYNDKLKWCITYLSFRKYETIKHIMIKTIIVIRLRYGHVQIRPGVTGHMLNRRF